MRKVITYGTFDLLHVGHVRLLKRARELGDYLIVAISTDEFNEIKGKKALFSFEERCELIQSLRFVDEVIVENNWYQKRDDIQKHNIDVFVIGDDWQGEFDFLEDICDVVYLERTKRLSTTLIRSKVIEEFGSE